MKRDYKLYINDLLDCIQKIEDFVRDIAVARLRFSCECRQQIFLRLRSF